MNSGDDLAIPIDVVSQRSRADDRQQPECCLFQLCRAGMRRLAFLRSRLAWAAALRVLSAGPSHDTANGLIGVTPAGDHITKLPESEHTAPEWQAAMEALILVATLGGPTMFARISVMRALNRNIERVFNPDRTSRALARPGLGL
jgi:hypothetical protein